MKLTVNLGKNSYPIYIENNILDKASSYISSCFSGKKIMIICLINNANICLIYISIIYLHC